VCIKEWWDLVASIMDRIQQEYKITLVQSLVLYHAQVFKEIPSSILMSFYNWRNKTTTNRLKVILQRHGRYQLAIDLTTHVFKTSILSGKT
jgi:hypothetical protein